MRTNYSGTRTRVCAVTGVVPDVSCAAAVLGLLGGVAAQDAGTKTYPGGLVGT